MRADPLPRIPLNYLLKDFLPITIKVNNLYFPRVIAKFWILFISRTLNKNTRNYLLLFFPVFFFCNKFHTIYSNNCCSLQIKLKNEWMNDSMADSRLPEYSHSFSPSLSISLAHSHTHGIEMKRDRRTAVRNAGSAWLHCSHEIVQ